MSSSTPSPPFLNRIWPTLLPVLAAFGIPAAVIFLFLTQHPLLALGIFLLYELGVFVVGFIGKVWGKLEDPLAEHIAAWLKHWAITLFSRYHRQYYNYLRHQHRFFNVKGLSTLGTYSLELDQVFIELSIDPTTPQQAIVNPVQVPLELSEGSHAIWDYLASPSLLNQHLVIIGPPGSGKTTLLKHITLTLVTRRKPQHRPHQPRIAYKLPFLLFLRDHANAIKEQSDFSLMDAVHDHLKRGGQPPPPQGWVERQLTRKRSIVMLDGLDEVADEDRRAVVNWVERQMVVYHRNRFIVTSRPFGYRSNPLNGVALLEVCPLTIEQVEQFIHQWYVANEIMSKQKNDSSVRIEANSQANALLQRLRSSPGLFDLTVNPLLLTMIATVHYYQGQLPGRQVDLYKVICEVFLSKRRQEQGQELELTPEQMQRVLEPVAYQMMLTGIRDIPIALACKAIKRPLVALNAQMKPEEFLQQVENVSGLLLERGDGKYYFAHSTFQEYLAAIHIREKKMGNVLVERVEAAWWHETIRFYCGMKDATPIIAACLDHPSVATIVLAIDCENEALQVQPDVKTRLETWLKQGVEHPDPELRSVIAGAQLARRLRQMVHLNEETYVDTSLVTCAEYQLFLDEQRARGLYLQPDHWISYQFPSGQGNAPVLGVRTSDAIAFCAWLTKREPDSWLYRLPGSGELVDESILGLLPADTGYWLKDGMRFAWAKGAVELSTSVLQKLTCRIFPRDLASVLDVHIGLSPDNINDIIIFMELNYHSRDRAEYYDLALALANALERALPGIPAFGFDPAPDRSRAHTLAIDLDHDLDHARTQGLGLDHNRAGSGISDIISARSRTLQLASSRQLEGLSYEDVLAIYVDLVILEARAQGELPACEGILIMKDHRREKGVA